MGGLRCLWVGTMLPQLRILPGQSGRGGAGWLSLGFLFKLPFLSLDTSLRGKSNPFCQDLPSCSLVLLVLSGGKGLRCIYLPGGFLTGAAVVPRLEGLQKCLHQPGLEVPES